MASETFADAAASFMAIGGEGVYLPRVLERIGDKPVTEMTAGEARFAIDIFPKAKNSTIYKAATMNVIKPRGHGTDALFYSSAFVRGFSDGGAGSPFRCLQGAAGPNSGSRSAEMAYERGRQFAVLWSGRPVSNLTRMIEALAQARAERLIN